MILLLEGKVFQSRGGSFYENTMQSCLPKIVLPGYSWTLQVAAQDTAVPVPGYLAFGPHSSNSTGRVKFPRIVPSTCTGYRVGAELEAKRITAVHTGYPVLRPGTRVPGYMGIGFPSTHRVRAEEFLAGITKSCRVVIQP
eukprot:3310139-Rhodomonas_salina.1